MHPRQRRAERGDLRQQAAFAASAPLAAIALALTACGSADTYGGGALAWVAACGTRAWSHDVAFGRHAIGAHGNDDVAVQFLVQHHA